MSDPKTFTENEQILQAICELRRDLNVLCLSLGALAFLSGKDGLDTPEAPKITAQAVQDFANVIKYVRDELDGKSPLITPGPRSVM